jgi:integrase
MDKDMALGMIGHLMEDAGLNLEEVASHQSSPGTSNNMTLGEYIPKVLSGLTETTAGSYKTHFDHLLNGIARQCTCICAECVAEFATTKSCRCECTKCAKAKDFPALAECVISKRAIADIDLDRLVLRVQGMATKRAMHANFIRARKGLAPKPIHGQGARQMCVSALRALFERMVSEGLIDINPAKRISKGRPSETKRRALTDDELTQLLAVVATGGDDPELDLALTWAELELGARRAGIVGLTVGQVDPVTQLIDLWEKGNKIGSQPCSLELISYLLAFAQSRGGNRCLPGHVEFDPNAPAFYFKDSKPGSLHRISTRRFDTLHKRIQLTLPWANSARYSGHFLRHTMSTLVERQAGHQTARKFLRHAGSGPTDTYVKAGTTEVAQAVSAITGFSHPLAREKE